MFVGRGIALSGTLQLVISFIPAAIRWSYGLHAFGETWEAKLVTSLLVWVGFVSGAFSILLIIASAYDFMRRLHAADMLSRLTTLPGVPESEFFANNKPEDGNELGMKGDTLLADWLLRQEEKKVEDLAKREAQRAKKAAPKIERGGGVSTFSSEKVLGEEKK